MALAIQKSRTPSVKGRLLSTLIMAFALMLQPMYGVVAGQVASAAPYVSPSHFGFDSLANWQTDRAAPSGDYARSNTNLVLNVDGDSPDPRAAGDAFRRTEGIKADLPAGTNSIKATLYVDPAWKDTIGVRAGIWGVTSDPSPYYPILEFSNRNDADEQVAGNPVIRAWDSYSGWVNLVTSPSYGSSYVFEIVHDPIAQNLKYYLNDNSTPAYTAAATANSLTQVIFNSYNPGIADNDYSVSWTNFEAGIKLPEPEIHSVRFSTMNTDEGSTYDGVVIDSYMRNFSDVTSVKVEIERADGSKVFRRGNHLTRNHIGQGGNRALTTPFSFDGDTGNPWWSPQQGATEWTKATKPVRVTIVVNTANQGKVTFSTPVGQELVEKNGTYGSLINPSTPTGLHRTVKGGGEILPCGATSVRRVLYPTWDAYAGNEEIDYFNYETSKGYTTTVSGNSFNTHNSTPSVDGSNAFRVQAVDIYGNESEWSSWCDVTYDSTAPSLINVTSDGVDVEGKTLNGEQEFKVNFADDDLAKAYVEYMRREWTESKGEWEYKKKHGEWFYDVAHPVLSVDTKDWGDGDYQIKVTKITDATGNTAPAHTVRFLVDNTAPRITVKDGYVGNKDQKVFSKVSFSLYDKYKVDYFTLNDHKYERSNNTYSDANFENIKSRLSQGENTLVLFDVAGNSSEYTFTYDSEIPTISGFEFQNAKDGTYNPAKVVARATDGDGSGVTNVYINVYKKNSSGEWQQQGGTYEQGNPSGRDFAEMSASYALISGDGTYKLEAWAKDAAGNVGDRTESGEFVVDNIAPVVTLEGAAEGEAYESPVAIRGTIDDENLNNYYLTVTKDGETINIPGIARNGSASSIEFTLNEVGSYVVKLEAIDKAGNKDGHPRWGDGDSVKTVSFSIVAPALGGGDGEDVDDEHDVEGGDGDLGGDESANTGESGEGINEEGGDGVSSVGGLGLPGGDSLGLLNPVQSEADPVVDSESEEVEGAVAGEQDESGTPLTDTAAFGLDAPKLLGLVWYWWLAIAAAIVGGWLLIAAAIRRNREEEA